MHDFFFLYSIQNSESYEKIILNKKKFELVHNISESDSFDPSSEDFVFIHFISFYVFLAFRGYWFQNHFFKCHGLFSSFL